MLNLIKFAAYFPKMKAFYFSIFLFLTSILNLSAQSSSVVLKGKVMDSADGYPLIGVAVMIKGEKAGTVTDLDGAYEIKVPKKQCEIVFSYVGYEEKTILFNLKNENAFSKVVMHMNMTQLDDVVVTGVYERKKESFTGASATFKADQLKSVGTSNVLQSLSTLDPSFKMMESSQFGSNPNVMPEIEIRGKTSVVGLKEEYGTVRCDIISKKGEDKSPCVDCCVFIANKVADLLDK